MKKAHLIREITDTYQRHGWELKRVLLRPEAFAEFSSTHQDLITGVTPEESLIDALWFSRASHAGAEAWELRLIAETPYALFERIEAGEDESKRAEILSGMEDRLRHYVTGP